MSPAQVTTPPASSLPQSSSYETQLSTECLAFAESELGETKETRERCMAEIDDWLDANPHINAHRDAQSVLHFLRGAKFRIEKAKKKMVK